MIEMQSALGGAPAASGMRALRRDRIAFSDVDLSCRSPSELRNALRRLAGAFTLPGARVHVEWLWDGERVWVVQYDTVAEVSSPQRPVAEGSASGQPRTQVFRPLRGDDSDLPKARCVAEYASLGLPHADLRVLRDRSTIGDLAMGEPSDALIGDLQALATTGAVIRTDTRRDTDFEVLLDRTDTEHSPAQLAQFLTQATKRLRDGGVPASNIAFIAHPFIPADAAAWSLAAPGSPEVRIDANYGLPDGLLYYAHDSYIVNVRRRSAQVHLRQKDRILRCDADGKWRTKPLGAPWDWRSCLGSDEAIEIAAISKKLADHLDRPVETMFLVRAHTASGPVSVLPWVHRFHDVDQAAIPATESHFGVGPAIEVRSSADLPRLRDALADLPMGQRLLIRLTPEGELLHKAGFLGQAIAEMRPERCEVEMAGSALSHVFYELRRAGVQVQASDPIEPTAAEPESFDKLVRDLIPERIASKGERVLAYSADGERLSRLLRQKLVEEAYETVAAESTDSRVEELGDVLDVVDALCAVSGTTLDAVKRWAEDKRRERGGFSQGVVLIETRDRTLDEALSGGGPTFGLSPELGAEVQTRRPTRGDVPVRLLDEVEVPYDIPDSTSRGTRLLVDGVELKVAFGSRGVIIEKVHSEGENPDQLTFDIGD